jgi:hypothetical protein
MKTAVKMIAAAVLAAGALVAAAPAAMAQYGDADPTRGPIYGPGWTQRHIPGYGWQQGYERPARRQYYQQEYQYEQRPQRRWREQQYNQPQYQYSQPQYHYSPPARTQGKVCGTAAGLCETRSWQPFGSGCRCLVSGVGQMVGTIVN